MIVFAHMMKTGGSSLIKLLIEYFGAGFLSTPNRLSLTSREFDKEELLGLLAKKQGKTKIIAGHPIRPFVDIKSWNQDTSVVTMFREPRSRFISHYFHDKYYRPGLFSKLPGEKSIVDWWNYHDYSNYQVRFLAGEPNIEKAKEVLSTKIDLVLKMEEMDYSLKIFRNYYALKGFPVEMLKVNRSQARKDEVAQIKKDFGDFIAEKNQLDSELYEYFESHIWKESLKHLNSTGIDPKKEISKFRRQANFWFYQIEKQLFFSEGRVLNARTIKRFLNRWKT